MAATLPSSVSRRCIHTCCFPTLFERPCSRVGFDRNYVCERESFSLCSMLRQSMTRGYSSVPSREETTPRLHPSSFTRVSHILHLSLGRRTPLNSSFSPRDAASTTKRAVSSAPVSRSAYSKPLSSDPKPQSLSSCVPLTKAGQVSPPLLPLRSCVPSLGYHNKGLLSRRVGSALRSPESPYPGLRISPESSLFKRSFHTYGNPTGAFSSAFSHAGRGYEGSPFVPPRHATTILCVRKGDQVVSLLKETHIYRRGTTRGHQEFFR